MRHVSLAPGTLRGPLALKALFFSSVFAACLDTGYVLRTEARGAGEGGANEGGGGLQGGGDESGSGGAAGAQNCDRTFAAGTDFAVCRARPWGADGEARLLAVAVDSEAHLLLGGHNSASELTVPTLDVTTEGVGILERADALGKPVARARIGDSVNDVALARDSVLVGSDRGITRVSGDLSAVLADQPIGEVLRISASEDRVLTLTGEGRVRFFDTDLGERGELPVAGDTAEDVAIDEATGLLVVTGSHAPPPGSECQGRLPFVRAYDTDASLVWSAYDVGDPLTWCASSTGRRIEIRQGKLYYVGQQQGGNSVHLRDPRDAAAAATLVSYDEFSTGAGKAIAVYSFVARFDLRTGELEAGQVVLPRDAGVGGVLSTSALAVDEGGRIFLGGQASCCVERRAEREVAGVLLGPYAGPEASLLVLSADFSQRLSWTTFTGAGGPADSNVLALAVGAGIGVAGIGLDASAALLSVPEEGPGAPPTGAHLVTFPAP